MQTKAAQKKILEVSADEESKILQERAKRQKAEEEAKAKKLTLAAKQNTQKRINELLSATRLSLKRIPLEILDEACRGQTADSVVLEIMERHYGKAPLGRSIVELLARFPALSDLLKRSKDAEKRLKFRKDTTAKRKADKERKEREDREYRLSNEREREKTRYCIICHSRPCRCDPLR